MKADKPYKVTMRKPYKGEGSRTTMAEDDPLTETFVAWSVEESLLYLTVVTEQGTQVLDRGKVLSITPIMEPSDD